MGTHASAQASIRRSEDGWTLKLAPADGTDEVLDRREIEAPGSPDHPPFELSALLEGVLRGGSLTPVATIETDRRAIDVAPEGRQGGALVEVSDDRASSTMPGGPGPSFRQIEVEAKSAGSDRLLAVVTDRLAGGGAVGTSSSKLERALRGEPGPEVRVPSLDRRSRVDKLARFAIAQSVERLIRHDPAVRLGNDPEAVHQARVATRRLRSDLKTLQPVLIASHVRRLRDDLAWVGGLLGAVRDLDVLAGRVQEQTGKLARSDRAASAAIVAGLREDRAALRWDLIEGLRSTRYVELLDALVDASRMPPLEGTSGRRRARPVLRKLVRKSWRRTARAVERLGPHPSDMELHEIRKRAKRARYAAELGHGVFGKPADRMAKRLAGLQDCSARCRTRWLPRAISDRLQTTASTAGRHSSPGSSRDPSTKRGQTSAIGGLVRGDRCETSECAAGSPDPNRPDQVRGGGRSSSDGRPMGSTLPSSQRLVRDRSPDPRLEDERPRLRMGRTSVAWNVGARLTGRPPDPEGRADDAELRDRARRTRLHPLW